MRRIEDYVMIGKDFYNPSNLGEIYIRAYHKGRQVRYEVRVKNKNEHYGDIVCKNFADLDGAEREAKRIELDIESCLRDKDCHEKQYGKCITKRQTNRVITWSQEDVEVAKAFKLIYPRAVGVRRDWGGLCLIDEREWFIHHIDDTLFYQLQIGETAKFDDILKEGV